MPTPSPSPDPVPAEGALACASCGSPLAELDGERACPECGTPVSLSAVLSTQRIPPGPAARRIAAGAAWIAGANAGALLVALAVLASPDTPPVPRAALAPLAVLLAAATAANAVGWTRIARGLAEAGSPAGHLAKAAPPTKGLGPLVRITAILNWFAVAVQLAAAAALVASSGPARDGAVLLVPLVLIHALKAVAAWAALHRVAPLLGARGSPWTIVAAHCVGILLAGAVPPLAALGWGAYTLRAIRMAAGPRSP